MSTLAANNIAAVHSVTFPLNVTEVTTDKQPSAFQTISAARILYDDPHKYLPLFPDFHSDGFAMNDAFLQEVAKHFRQHMPVERGSKGMVRVKPFAEGQRWSEMLGYVQKDAGRATYRLVTHNVTDLELTEVRVLE